MIDDSLHHPLSLEQLTIVTRGLSPSLTSEGLSSARAKARLCVDCNRSSMRRLTDEVRAGADHGYALSARGVATVSHHLLTHAFTRPQVGKKSAPVRARLVTWDRSTGD
jgi:hypothetical protein